MKYFATLCLALFWFSCIPGLAQRLKIGVNFQSPPFCFITEEDGKKDTVGLEYELAIRLAKYIAQKKGITYFKPQFINVRSAGERETLLAHNVDFIIDRFSLTPERKKKIIFSNHYYLNPTSLVMLSHKDREVRTIGFLRKSTADDYYRTAELDAPGQESRTLVSVLDQKTLLRQFFERDFDAIVDDKEFLEYLHSHAKDFTSIVSLPGVPADAFAIAISKRREADLELINDFIKEVKSKYEPNGRVIVENLLERSKDKKPPPGIIIYPKEKDYVSIIAIFFGIPTAAMILLIFIGNRRPEEKGKPAQFEITEEPMNFAWIIANSKYEHKNGLSNYPYNDAIKLKEALREYSFCEDHIAIQKDLTRKGIIKTFQDIACRYTNAEVPFSDIIRSKDNLLIYFSGHGDKAQIGTSQIGFWIPVDGSSSWEYVPDYEVKAMLGFIDVKQILLIADSCFSGTLLNGESLSDNANADQCIQIITSGNNRVPAESVFLGKLTQLLMSHPRESLTSTEIYDYLRSELTNNRHYQPQFGSPVKGYKSADFCFRKLPITQITLPDTSVRDQIKSVLDQFSRERRIISYSDLRAGCQLDEKCFSQIIAELMESRLVVARPNSSIFITTNGLSYEK